MTASSTRLGEQADLNSIHHDRVISVACDASHQRKPPCNSLLLLRRRGRINELRQKAPSDFFKSIPEAANGIVEAPEKGS